MLPFPSPSELNSLLPDHRLDQATYNAAKRLYETRTPPPLPEGLTIASQFHMRECVQVAICYSFMQRNSPPGMERINYAA